MSSLIEEYRQRHGMKCVWPRNEGMLFFNCKNKPFAIVLTSSITKSLTICRSCIKNPESIIVEMYRRYSYPYCLQRVTHIHVPPDADIIDYVVNHIPGGEDCVPYIASGERDQERWLWELYLETKPNFLKSAVWKSFMKNSPSWVDQATWLAVNNSEFFKSFYNNIYSVCMVNRHYILNR